MQGTTEGSLSYWGTAGQSTGEPVRVLLADDQAVFRMGLKRQLTALGFAIVGEASNGRDAVRLAHELRPDVVVVDPEMPILDGIAATREIAALPQAPAVLVLSCNASTPVLDAVLAGACSVLPRTADAPEIAQGIRAAARGDAALAPNVAAALVGRLRELELARAMDAQRLRTMTPPDLSARECEVLKLVALGRDNSTIGQELFISASTVKNHVAHILQKLGLENRTQAAAEAVRIGLA